jgi:hypothetical protein
MKTIGLTRAQAITTNHKDIYHMTKPGSDAWFVAVGPFEAEWWMAQGYYALHVQSGKVISTSQELWA